MGEEHTKYIACFPPYFTLPYFAALFLRTGRLRSGPFATCNTPDCRIHRYIFVDGTL